MPRFYFHVENGSAHDEDGVELPNLDAAKRLSVKLAGEMILESAATFWDRGELSLRVTNEAALTLFTLQLVGIESPAIVR